MMPFGLCDAPSAFQRVMTCAFLELLHTYHDGDCDDFSTQSSKASHLSCVRESFSDVGGRALPLIRTRFSWRSRQGVLLGIVVSKEGREPDPEKIRVITELSPPVDVKEVQRTLGHIGWYRGVDPRLRHHFTPY